MIIILYNIIKSLKNFESGKNLNYFNFVSSYECNDFIQKKRLSIINDNYRNSTNIQLDQFNIPIYKFQRQYNIL